MELGSIAYEVLHDNSNQLSHATPSGRSYSVTNSIEYDYAYTYTCFKHVHIHTHHSYGEQMNRDGASC